MDISCDLTRAFKAAHIGARLRLILLQQLAYAVFILKLAC